MRRAKRIATGLVLLASSVISSAGIPEGTPLFSWVAPTVRESGDPLAPGELAGFKIYCNGSEFVEIQDPTATQYQAGPMSPGDYACGMSAIDTDGREGAVSDPATFTISGGEPVVVALAAPADFSVRMSQAPPPPPEGDMQVATGFLTSPVSGDNPASVSVTGLGFQPKALMIYATGRYSFNNLDSSNIYQSVGMTDGTRQASYWTAVQNNTRTTEFGRDTTKLINMRDHTGADLLVATFGSFDADGFTVDFTVSDAHPGIRYIALGGSGLTNAYLANGILDLDSGSDPISAIGFEPDAVIARTSFFTGGTPNTNGFGFGAAVNGGNQWAMAYRQRDNRNTGGVYDFADEILLAADDSASRIGEANISAWNADGVTLTAGITAAGDQLAYSLLCLKGGQYAIGSFTSPTANGNHVESGLPFQPVGLLLASTNETDSPEGATGNPTAQSVGFADGTNQNVVGFEHHGGSNSSTYGQYNTHIGLVADSNGGAPLAEETAQFTSFNSDGFTLNFDLADALAWNYAYLAFGSTSGGPVDVALNPVNATGSLPVSQRKETGLDATPVSASSGISAENQKVADQAPGAVSAAGSTSVTPRKETGLEATPIAATSGLDVTKEKISTPALAPLSAVASIGVSHQVIGGAVDVALGPLAAGGVLDAAFSHEALSSVQVSAAGAISISYGPEDAQNVTPLAAASAISAQGEKTADINAGAVAASSAISVAVEQVIAGVVDVALSPLSASSSIGSQPAKIGLQTAELAAAGSLGTAGQEIGERDVILAAVGSTDVSSSGIKGVTSILSAAGAIAVEVSTLKQTAAYLDAAATISVSHYAGFAADIAGEADLVGLFCVEASLTGEYGLEVRLEGRAENVG